MSQNVLGSMILPMTLRVLPRAFVLAAFGAGGALLACGGSGATSPEPAPGAESGAADAGDPKAALAAQIEHGKQKYTQYCAGCHGAGGEGTDKAPAVVGAGALPLDPPESRQFRKNQFVTAADVASFAVPNMPPDPTKRGELTEADYWAILAFDLTANGIQLTEPVNAGNAASLTIPR